MKYPAELLLLLGLTSIASANTFRLECVDADDGKTRLALIEVSTTGEYPLGAPSRIRWRGHRCAAVASAAGLDVMNCVLRGTQRRIDVPNSTISESSCVRIVLFAISVRMYLS